MKKEDKFVESNQSSIQVLRIGPKLKESDIALFNSEFKKNRNIIINGG